MKIIRFIDCLQMDWHRMISPYVFFSSHASINRFIMTLLLALFFHFLTHAKAIGLETIVDLKGSISIKNDENIIKLLKNNNLYKDNTDFYSISVDYFVVVHLSSAKTCITEEKCLTYIIQNCPSSNCYYSAIMSDSKFIQRDTYNIGKLEAIILDFNIETLESIRVIINDDFIAALNQKSQ